MGGSRWAKKQAIAEAGEEREKALAPVAKNKADRKRKRGQKG